MDKKLTKKIVERQEKGTLRSLSSFADKIDFISNDYLGLSNYPTDNNKDDRGSTGSRLISGNSKRIEEIEEDLAKIFGFDAALIFNSGYDANLGLFSSIPQRNDIVLYDESIHASVRDGIRLSLAKSYSFKHNDLADLERLLVKFKRETVYIATEGLYSMSGDFAAIEELNQIAEKNGARIIIDEAHSVGVIGEGNRGLVQDSVEYSNVDIKLITCGKALGTHGAVVFCSKDYKNFLINFCRPFIFSTAIPEGQVQRIYNQIQLLKNAKVDLLRENIKYFRENSTFELLSDENSPIQIVKYGSNELLKISETNALNIGFAVKAIYPPTVSEGEECLRVCIHSFNTQKEIDFLLKYLA